MIMINVMIINFAHGIWITTILWPGCDPWCFTVICDIEASLVQIDNSLLDRPLHTILTHWKVTNINIVEALHFIGIFFPFHFVCNVHTLWLLWLTVVATSCIEDFIGKAVVHTISTTISTKIKNAMVKPMYVPCGPLKRNVDNFRC